MKLSIVILNYNVCFFLELCLESVHKAVRSVEAEVIVVDNNSTDNSCAMVKSRFPNVILIENQNNYGFSKGNNIGVAAAKGEYICILNPDTVIPENVFSTLLNFADKEPDLGLLGCKLVDGRGQFLPESKRNIPYPSVALKKMLGSGKSYYSNHIKPDEDGKVHVLVGAFMLVKRDVYNKVQGFDEDYFMYGEDVDLSYKILNAGFKNYYFGGVTVIHFKGESTLKNIEYAKRFYGAMQIFYKKHFRRNLFFDFIVWLGIKAAFVFRPKESIISPIYRQILIFTKSSKIQLPLEYDKPIRYETDINSSFDDDTLVVFDTQFLNFEKVIQVMEKNSNRLNIMYRFISKSSTFIVGSDSASQRGEVIML